MGSEGARVLLGSQWEPQNECLRGIRNGGGGGGWGASGSSSPGPTGRMAKSPAGAVTHGLPAASPRPSSSGAPNAGAGDREAVRAGLRGVLSAARAAPVAAKEEAHASREARGPRAAVAAARHGKS